VRCLAINVGHKTLAQAESCSDPLYCQNLSRPVLWAGHFCAIYDFQGSVYFVGEQFWGGLFDERLAAQ